MKAGSLFSILLSGVLLVVACGQPAPPPEQPEVPGVPVDIYAEAPLLRVAYVGHDHHSAVYVSALRGDRMKELYGIYLVPLRERELFALIENNVKVAEIELIQASGGGSVVPAGLAAGEYDLGFGGVAAFVSSSDAGTGVKIVSPLHAEGDMLVVAADNEAVSDWPSFIQWVRNSSEPVVVGYKNPTAVAMVIFQAALTAEGIQYSQGTPSPGALVVMMNMQGEENLNPGLASGTIDAYVSNNPWCALAEYNGEGKCVAPLSTLPPGTYRNHPCCAIAASLDARENKAAEIAAALRLFAAATDYINTYPDDAAAAVAEWLGNPVEVELASMATSVYDMSASDPWNQGMLLMIEDMKSRNLFAGPLAGLSGTEAMDFVSDLSLLPEGLR